MKGLGFILWLVSNILYYGLLPLVFIINPVYYFLNRKFFKSLQEIDRDLFIVGISNDQKGNVVFKHVFNMLLIKDSSKHRFGNEDETISSVLGKAISWILNKLDPNHVEKSIGS